MLHTNLTTITLFCGKIKDFSFENNLFRIAFHYFSSKPPKLCFTIYLNCGFFPTNKIINN